MKPFALSLALIFSLISLVKAQDGNVLAFHQISGNQTIELHPGDFVKIHTTDPIGKWWYKGTFSAFQNDSIQLKYQKASIPIQKIDFLKIRPHKKDRMIWRSLAIGLLLIGIGFLVLVYRYFSLYNELEKSDLKTGKSILFLGAEIVTVLVPILTFTTVQPISNLHKDWTYEIMATSPTNQPPVP